jgi:hypothetical protein
LPARLSLVTVLSLVAFTPLLFVQPRLVLILVLLLVFVLVFVLLFCVFYFAYVTVLEGFWWRTLGKAAIGNRGDPGRRRRRAGSR